MFKLARRLIAGILVLVLLLVVAGGVIFWRIDSLAKRGVESGGTYALGVPTTVRGVDVGLLRGTVELDGLKIANPAGFTTPTFLSMNDARTEVSLGTLRNDVIRIPVLRMEDIEVVLERNAAGATNYQSILDNLEKLGGEKPREQPEGEPGAEKRLIINELVIRNVRVHADLVRAQGVLGGAAGQLAKVTVPIDEIRLTDVGKTGEGVGGSGVTIGELAGLLVEAVLAAAVEKGGDILPAELLGDLRGRLGELGNLPDVGREIMGQVQDLGKDLQGARTQEDVRGVIEKGAGEVKKIEEGLRDLIPKKK